MMDIVTIPLERIDIVDRLREVDADHVAVIADSIREIGQRTPIEVQFPDEAGHYVLISGAHRVAAMRLLGRPAIQARIFEGEDSAALLVEIDENLCRHDLTPLDRATFLAERKRVYDRLHPETTRGKARLKDKSPNLGFSPALTFTKDAAERLGLSLKDVARSITRYNKIDPDVRRRLSGTVFATKGSDLDALAKLNPEEQRLVVDLLLAPDGGVRSVAAAVQRVRGAAAAEIPAADDQFRRLVGAWTKAEPEARRRFVDFLVSSGEIDAVRKKAAAGPRRAGAGA